MRPDNITMHNAERTRRTMSPYIRTQATSSGYRRRKGRGVWWVLLAVVIFVVAAVVKV
ncbi:MAG: hypothetical protein AB7I35_21840 [Ramlibacter sp.]